MDRLPNYNDFRDTYPSTETEDSEALTMLTEKLEEPFEVWKKWIKNCEIPFEKNNGTILNPEITKDIWDSGIYNPYIEMINQNISIEKDKTPENPKVIMHEVMTILNLYLNNRNLQITSYLDTVILEPEGNKEGNKIKIVDFKTGKKDFSKITNVDKLQALIMAISAYYSFHKNKIYCGISDWDATHEISLKGLPNLEKRPIYDKLEFKNRAHDYEVKLILNQIINTVKFYLNNPITGESVEIKYGSSSLKLLNDLQKFNEFFYCVKWKLKQPKLKLFETPKFVPQRVLNPKQYEKVVQNTGAQLTIPNLF